MATAGLMDCPDCGRKVSKMAPACPECGRPFFDDCEDYFEPPWPMRLLYFIVAPFMTVGALLLMVGVALLGFGFVAVGCLSMPSSPILGGILFIFGCGIWLTMIFKGINAMFGGR